VDGPLEGRTPNNGKSLRLPGGTRRLTFSKIIIIIIITIIIISTCKNLQKVLTGGGICRGYWTDGARMGQEVAQLPD
jgi:hypothetical protein